MFLTQKQKSILYGTILGDAYLQKTGKKNARIRLEHGKAQKDFLFWKVEMLSPLFQGKPKYLERINPITKKQYCYWRHQSQTMPYLGKLRRIFYPDGKKHIPKDLDKYITATALAVWYMDDGYYYGRDKCSYLYLGNVSLEEAETVFHLLKEKFDILTIVKQKKKGYALYFPPDQTRKLKKLIKRYTIPLFDYKFPS